MTAPWFTRVRDLLAEGYGTEDCAVILGIPIEDVRQVVALCRAAGTLRALVTHGVGR